MRIINPNIKVVGEYQSNHIHIEVECKVCGHKWMAMPSNLLRNYGCPNCNGGIKQTKEQFESRMEKIHPDIELLGEYNGSMNKTTVKCKVCGYTWETSPQSLILMRTGCPKCHKVARKDTRYFIDEISQVNSKITILGEYISAKEKILVRCNQCGFEWYATPDKLRIGRGCPKCGVKRSAASKIRR